MISCRELARRMFPRIFVEAIIFAVLSSAILVAEPALKLLAFYSTNVESDHAKTANNAIAFYRDLAAENNFVFDVTMDGGKLNDPLAQRLPEDVAAACCCDIFGKSLSQRIVELAPVHGDIEDEIVLGRQVAVERDGVICGFRVIRFDIGRVKGKEL